MANDISGNLPIQTGSLTPGRIQPPGAAKTAEGDSFKDMLTKSLDEVNRLQQDADVAFKRFSTGQTENVTEVFEAVKKATLGFDTLVQIRSTPTTRSTR